MPNATSHAAVTRAVSGLSGHGHRLRAVAGATNSTAPTTSMIEPCTVSTTASQPGGGWRRSGSTPGIRCCRTASRVSATGTTT